MLQKTFSVDSTDISQATVFAEAAPSYLCVWAKDTLHHKVIAFEWFQWDLSSDNATTCFQEAKQRSALLTQPMHFHFNFPHTAIIPASYWKQSMAEDFLTLQYGPSADIVKYIHGTTNKHAAIVTRLPEAIIDSVINQYDTLSINPAWMQVIDYTSSILPKGETVLYLFFYPGSFTPVLYVNGSLQFISNQAYTQAESVLYTILHLLHQHNLSPVDTKVFTAGMLHVSSPLFALLYQYLGKIEMPADVIVSPADAFSEIEAHILLPFAAYHL